VLERKVHIEVTHFLVEPRNVKTDLTVGRTEISRVSHVGVVECA
jgi:hypothetical protein